VEQAGYCVLFCLVLIVFAIYWAVGGFEFVNYDNTLYVSQNEIVGQGLSWNGLGWAFYPHACNWHPLTWLSHMMDCQLFGLNAGAHHWVTVSVRRTGTIRLPGECG
jgi:hypothetical protein